MCTTSGKQAGTACVIFEKMDGVLQKHGISWDNCISLSVDNTSVNMGRNNSLRSRVLIKNPSVYVIGCPCHIIHNTSSKAAEALTGLTGFDIEDLAVDISYWFQGSTKRKAGLEEFCIFCDTTYKEVVAHCSTRWLSLEKAITRILELYNSLASYFISNDESQARFKRLHDKFSKPMTEIYLLFFQSVIPTFTRFNQLLQREDPSIYLLHSQIRAFVKNIICRFIIPQEIVKAKGDATKVNCSIQLEDDKVHIGMVTRSKLRKLLEEGDISPTEVSKFMKGVRAFYETSVSYALGHLPFDDELLENATFVDITMRTKAAFSQVTYFVERFSGLLPYSDLKKQDLLFAQFAEFQIMPDNEIPLHIWNDAKVYEKQDSDAEQTEYYRMDILWGYLGSIKDQVTGQFKYKMIANVAILVLTIPHSNADEERVFSLVRQNKTDFRRSLSLDETLSSILTVKMASEEPCYKFEPPSAVVQQSKKVTRQYNQKHNKQ